MSGSCDIQVCESFCFFVPLQKFRSYKHPLISGGGL